MDLNSPAVFWTVYSGCNILALITLIVCLEKPLVARLVYSIFFGLACMLTAYLGFFHPETYMHLAQYSLLPIYKSFILGWFSQHTPEFILAVATAQLWIGISIWGRGRFFTGGVIAGIFLLALLLPLGLGAAFPAPLNMIVGLRLLLSGQSRNYLWPVFVGEYAKAKSYVHG